MYCNKLYIRYICLPECNLCTKGIRMIQYKNIFSYLIVALSVLIFTSCKDERAPQGANRAQALSAEGFRVTPDAFSDVYAASGTLLPAEEVDIHPEIIGRVTGIHFKEGSYVGKGQLLVQLYSEDISAQINKLQAQRKLQQKTEERQKALLDIGGISQQDYEATITQVQSIDADIDYAQAQLRATRILAPFSGTIGIRNISVGAVVSPSTLIATLQQTNTLKMDFDVPDRYYGALKDGKTVSFSVNGILDTLTGRIIAIEPGANSITRTVRVRAEISNPDNRLVAGSFAHVMVPIESNANAILIPSQSIIPTTKDKLVAVVKDGKAKMTKVTLGARTDSKVEVLNGLQAGDTVLTTGIMQVKDGMPVNITKLQS